jgi:hypothetical protein
LPCEADVQNGRLKIPMSLVGELPFDTLNVSEFVLEGPKELLQQIQEQHNGHYDEKGPVTQTAPRQIKLKVASLTHIEEGCVPRP